MKTQKKKDKQCIYTRKHYNSNDGMITFVWGPMIWNFLHIMSFNYPLHPTKEQKKHYRDFILSLKYILPCGKCRENLIKNFKKHPLTYKHMENRYTFSKYVYTLHEVVNTMLGKKSGLSYGDVRDRFEIFRARCLKSSTEPIIENGCVEPLRGEKSKCVLNIVPITEKCDTFNIDDKCIPKKL